MKYITGKQIVFGWLAVALVLLTGCQSDGADTPRQMATMEMQAYATSYVDAMPAASTRAGEWVPSGFTLYTGHDDIRLAFTQVKEGVSSIAKCYNPEIPGVNDKDAKGVFSFQNGKWGSSFYLPQAGSYYLYGFMSNGGNLDNLTPATEGYNAGATLNMTGLPTATSHDICVIVGVKKGVETPASSGNYSGSGIQVGQFGYTIDAGQNHVFLLCDHLYAALRLSIKVDETYHALRHIKLKKVWVKDCKNGDAAPFTSKTNVEISLLSNTTTPIKSIAFTNDDSNSVIDMELSPLYKSDEGLDLSGDNLHPTYVQGFMAPIGMTEFTLVSQYDVYDTNGNLIRENQTAENKIIIKNLFTATTSLVRGTRYTLHLTVNPTYLYVLSEPDLDNPTVEVTGGS